jgi:hypothetical protein
MGSHRVKVNIKYFSKVNVFSSGLNSDSNGGLNTKNTKFLPNKVKVMAILVGQIVLKSNNKNIQIQTFKSQSKININLKYLLFLSL